MLLVYIYVALASYNTGYLTLPLGSIDTIIDDAANVATIDGKGKIQSSHGGNKGRERDRRDRPERERTLKDWKELWSRGTDAVMDVPLGGVCEVLYGEFREGRGDEDEDMVS